MSLWVCDRLVDRGVSICRVQNHLSIRNASAIGVGYSSRHINLRKKMTAAQYEDRMKNTNKSTFDKWLHIANVARGV
jgi:hypothetical protein